MQSTSHVIVRPQAVPHQNRLARGLTVLVLGLALVMGNTLQGQARGAPESFADLAENVSPAVVNITTSTTVAAPAEALPQVPPGSPFEDFFKEFMDRNGQGNGQGNGKPRRSQALGSGFVVSEDVRFRAPMTTSSRPMPRSTRATRVVRCSTWTVRLWG